MDANIIKVYRIPSIIVFISRWIINGPQAPKFYTFEPARKIMMMNWIALSISVPNEHAWWKCNINHSSWRTQEPALLSFLFRLSRHNRHIHPKELSLWWNTASPGRRGNCDMDFADTVGCCPLLLNCAERAVCCSWRAVWSPLTSKMCLLRHFMFEMNSGAVRGDCWLVNWLNEFGCTLGQSRLFQFDGRSIFKFNKENLFKFGCISCGCCEVVSTLCLRPRRSPSDRNWDFMCHFHQQ